MQKKRRKPTAHAPVSAPLELASSMSRQVWVRPNSNLIQERKETDPRNITPASAKKLLELADVALGLRNVAKKSAKLLPSPEAHHQRLLQRKGKRPLQAN